MSQLYKSIAAEIESRRHRFGFSYGRMFSWLASAVLFGTISVIAIVVALGFRFDVQAREVQETALIQLDGPFAGVKVQTYLNGTLQSDQLPLRLSNLQPGRYRIEIKKTAYQSIDETVELGQNQRIVIDPVILIYNDPQPILNTEVTAGDSRFRHVNQGGLEIRNADEIWLNQQFLTRTSENIISLAWYASQQYVVYQTENDLVLLDKTGHFSQTLHHFSQPQAEPVPYFFTEDGRVLWMLEDATKVWRIELFEQVNLIDHLAAGH